MAGIVLLLVGLMSGLFFLSARYMPSSINGTVPAVARHSLPQPISTGTIAQWNDDAATASVGATKKKVAFILDKCVRIGKTIVTYRGLEGKSKFKLDVIIMDLDPEFVYSRTIEISQARKEFRVGEKHFSLISARRSRLRVWYHN